VRSLFLVMLLLILYYCIVEIISPSKHRGYLSVVLHAHLPFIRYPAHEGHLEENWLYEAITETYIPLLDIFGNLLSDGIDFRITLSVSPTLVGMFNDYLLMARYKRYIESRIELAEKEVVRTRRDRGIGPVARMYHKRFLKIRHLFDEVFRRDLPSALGQLSGSGKIEVITCPATHPYLPALMTVPEAAWVQIALGAEYFRTVFGKRPDGMWLPECGFVPDIDIFLKKAGIEFFFLESHGLLRSAPEGGPKFCSPVRTPSGVAAFARDAESSGQVWSSAGGYPGDPDYRDFYRDIGFDLPSDYIGQYLPDGVSTFTGLKYYRITGGNVAKKPYVCRRARKKAELHADHFIAAKKDQILFLREKSKTGPVVTAAYDAELFGHWWFEGTDWLNFVLRKGSREQKVFRFINPREYLSSGAKLETAMPAASSWGEGGYSSTWVNDSNSWIYRHLTRGARLMKEIAGKNFSQGMLKRAADQAARELLLAQSSDWAFMMKTGNASEFARKKFTGHMNNFLSLHAEIASGKIRRKKLLALEQANNLFPDLDHRMFGSMG
jgi:1,4-alpha-glucan branching enzyme